MWKTLEIKNDREEKIKELKKNLENALKPIFDLELEKLDNYMMILNAMKKEKDEHLDIVK
jgi:hypothetical protein